MNLYNIQIPFRNMGINTNKEGDIYLLDSKGYSHICNKNSETEFTKKNSDYVCTDIINGKAIVFNEQENVYKECNVDLSNNTIDYSQCNNVPYEYILRNVENSCILSDLNGKEIYNTKNEDFPEQCCSGIYQCGSMGENNKESDSIYSKRYMTYSPPKKKFACLKNKEQCVPFPDDYNEEKYPDINPDKVFDCNKCNCCSNLNGNSNIISYMGNSAYVNPTCKVCPLNNNPDYTPPEKVNRYSCNNGYCSKDDNGFYYDKITCENSCNKASSNNKIVALLIFIILLLITLFFIISRLNKGNTSSFK